MLRIKHTLPAFALLLTSMAYGQHQSTNFQTFLPGNYVDGTTENLKARLQASSNYEFANGAFSAEDSVRIYHMNGKNASQLWLAVNPYNILNTGVGFEWDYLKNSYSNAAMKNVDTLFDYFWSSSLGNWDISEKVEVTDIVGNTTIARTSTVNNASLMEKENRYYEFYNAENKIDSVIVENWDGSNWIKASKAQFTYDTLSTEPTITESDFDATNNTWVAKKQYSVVKNGNVYQEFIIGELDSVANVIPTSKVVYGYDSEGKLTSKTFLSSVDGSTFDPTAQELYTFDINGKHIQSEATNWDALNGDWIGNRKSIYEYNAEGLLENRINQNHTGSTYVNSNKQTLKYTDGTLTSVEHSTWNSLEWNLNSREIIEDKRDGNGGTVVVSTQDWNTGNFWELNNGNEIANYYFEEYNDDGTKIEKLNTAQISLYPNPSNNNINIEVANGKIQQVNIYNISGALVMTVKTTATNKTNIEISNLQSGLYQVQVVTENGVGTQKLNVVK